MDIFGFSVSHSNMDSDTLTLINLIKLGLDGQLFKGAINKLFTLAVFVKDTERIWNPSRIEKELALYAVQS